MRAVVFLAAFWLMPFLFFGWRMWAAWPSERERERQREVSKLYDYHFKRQRRRSYSSYKLRWSRGGWAEVQPSSIGGSARSRRR
jgi:hypothetical protein